MAAETDKTPPKIDYEPLPEPVAQPVVSQTPQEPVPAAPDTTAKINYEFGKGLAVKSSDENYLLRFQVRIKPRYQYIWTSGPNRVNVNTFNLSLMRTILSGNAINKDLRYFIQTEFYPTVNLKDAFIDYKIIDEFQVLFGQTFIPFCRDLLGSSVKLQLVSNANTLTHFCPIRDIGIEIHGDVTKWLTYETFFVNGEGNNTPNFNKEMAMGLRLTGHLLGSKLPYQEGDLENSKSPRLALGGGVLYDFGYGKETTTGFQNRLLKATADMAFAYRGIYLLGGTFLLNNLTLRKTDLGFLGQAGYFIWPKRLELASRFSAIVPAKSGSALPMSGLTKGSSIPQYETGFGLNYMVFGTHEFKVQTDFTTLYNANGIQNMNDHRFQFQVQVFF
ncbi:MAG: hypothetical protein HYS22_08290 [Deltaproteobacteria bacterium]|nr:hypothetical protein [Deltaproteobacteria bacterium]